MAMCPEGLRRWLKGEGGRVGVKVCGITREEDALVAIEAGVDALGFNFYPRSKRAVRLDDVAAWIEKLPPGIGRVAVVVNPEESLLRELTGAGLFHSVQFHGGETHGFCAQWGGDFYIRAAALSGENPVAAVLSDPAPCLLLDAHAPGVFGGTGRTIDWTLAAEAVRDAGRPVVLSGGLHPGNVAGAVLRVWPVAVDAASGVETAPGIKGAALMRDFVAAVRGMEAVRP